MEALILSLAVKYPLIFSVVTVIGTLRVIVKPIMSGIQAAVAATESKKDDAVLAEVEASKAYKLILWLLDYVASIKIPPVK